MDYLMKGDGNAAQMPANLQKMQVFFWRHPALAV